MTMFSLLLYFQVCFLMSFSTGMTDRERIKLREDVRGMFYHAYEGYMKYAYPYDELRPLSCDGHDTWGSYSLTLIDALDTLGVMGNKTEFRRVVELIIEKANFDVNINVSVFETNIRILGGLLSGHLMSKKMGIEVEDGWPCAGPLLRISKDVADRLLPAFDTPTGMPYGTVNLRDGVPEGETPITCTAGVGTYIIEFGTLSRLTGDPVYEEVAMRALHGVWDHRSSINLVGNHIDVLTGRWAAQDSGIGAGIDSYFEYLVKGAALLQKPELMRIFNQARTAIDKYLRHEDWYLWATMTKGYVTMAVFQSLEAYWPGVLALLGDINSAQKIIFNYHQVWKQFGFTPEFYSIPQAEAPVNREGYPLRPELIESLMYLFQATNDDTFLEMGADILTSIQHTAKTECGYATVKNVNDHTLENRMESFFLAETTKYLFLLFDSENWMHNTGVTGQVHKVGNRECIIEAGGYIYNSEAHPVDPGALACCYTKDDDWSLPVSDQVSLILDPTAPWVQHKGNKIKKENPVPIVEDCEEGKTKPPSPDQQSKLTVNEAIIEDSINTLKEHGNILTIHQPLSHVIGNKDNTQNVKSGDVEKQNLKSERTDTSDTFTKEKDINPNNILDYEASTVNSNKDIAAGSAFNKFESGGNDSDDEEPKMKVVNQHNEIKQEDSSQGEIMVENDASPKVIKKDGGPRFSSLSESAERGLGGNTSGMEAASITPSVSSSKYSTSSPSTPTIVSEPKETKVTKPVKKVFVLSELKERLITDLANYKNFTLSASYLLLSCAHPPFSQLLNFKGQMINP
ncbi:ER degradation-enhancing alpha-mannosidase-like protein 2 [Procambarus clarkii]|uniref:ER degradation-enhancing alpha-mannosidase-like protein 2 n=1 Tax=Procambarus clarkii TaxID=6728 RepID=UPI0037449C3D